MTSVTVITPTYGTPVRLERAIESALSQEGIDLDMIVVDDNDPASPHRSETEEVLRGFHDPRLQYVQHPRNLNGACARNTGLSRARGEYVSFLDSDDEYCPGRLMRCAAALRTCDSAVAGAYTGCEFRRDGRAYRRYTGVRSGNFLASALACDFMFCTGSNLFIRRSVADELRGFDETFLRHQDYEFLVRLFTKYSLVAVPDILVVKNNDNLNVPCVEKQIAIKRQYLTKFSALIEALGETERKQVYHANYVSVAEHALKEGNRRVASEYYAKAVHSGSLTLREAARKMALKAWALIKR